jgi:UDP-N-acetylmuramate--alanine ligase
VTAPTEAGPGGRLHFIGIGGAGMSVIAELFLAQGRPVSGSDARGSATLDRLAALGADVHVGHAPEHVTGAQTVVISTAVRPDNVELVAARTAGIRVVHRSEALALVAEGKDFVAVAGAHGKTTTSSMLALALAEVGADPSYAIGGEVVALGTGAHAGAGRAFVAEADESDRSFLAYRPQVAVVTNIEADHLDQYASASDVEVAFEEFAARIVPGGLLVACLDDPGAERLARRAAGSGTRVRTYGRREAPSDFPDGTPGGRALGADHVEVVLERLHAAGSVAHLTWHRPGAEPVRVPLDLAVPGAHNVLNAAAAWAAGVDLGAPPEALAAALGRFTGTRRRFEERGVAAGVRVVDDYAHHPTEVTALLAAARLAAGDGRVLALFQPHLYSRTLSFAREFAHALASADQVVVTGIYGAREDPRPGVTGGLITEAMVDLGAGSRARYVPDRLAAAAAIADLARPGDLLLTVGAGDVTELAEPILEALRARA